MLPELPPYALAPLAFPLAGLAQCASRLPLGGGREIVLATFAAARLGTTWLETPVPEPGDRQQRATLARAWLASLALQSSVRAPLLRAIDAAAAGPAQCAAALRTLTVVAGAHLDAAATRELGVTVRRLEALVA